MTITAPISNRYNFALMMQRAEETLEWVTTQFLTIDVTKAALESSLGDLVIFQWSNSKKERDLSASKMLELRFLLDNC